MSDNYRIYKNNTVLEEALIRINRLFDEFDNIIVNVSGGKDSTVVLNLCLKVAEERGKLPLKVLFLDQEAEWDSVINYVRTIMCDDRIDPLWFQMWIKIENATSSTERFMNCWGPDDEHKWMRKKEENSIKENNYGTNKFADIFGAILEKDYKDKKTCYIAGVRTEESPARLMGLISALTYKDITWGKILNKDMEHYTFYPIYDWTYLDVWKYIFSNNIPYCDIYDKMYSKGVSVNNMRVSNLHHETAVHNLFILQEIEGETWNKLTKRVAGIDTAGKLGKEDYFVIEKLPYMFDNWREYRTHLANNLLSEDVKEKFWNKFAAMDEKWKYLDEEETIKMYKAQINCILCNDWLFTKLNMWENKPNRKEKKKSSIENDKTNN